MASPAAPTSADSGAPRPPWPARPRVRLLVVIAWATLAGVALPLASSLDGRLESASRIPSSESARVERRISTEFATPFARFVTLVVRGLPSAGSESGRIPLRPVVQAIEELPHVAGTVSPTTSLDTLLLGQGGVGAVVVVGLQTGATDAEALAALRSTTSRLADSLRTDFPDVDLSWTGEAALNHDLRTVGSEEARRAELRAIPLSALLALWAFRSVPAAFLAAVFGALTITVALGICSLIATVLPLTLLAQNVVSLLGLALGIDYALFLVWRWRDGGDDGLSSGVRTVVLAATAVGVGLSPLMVVPVTEVRSVGVAAVAAVGVAVTVSATLVPAIIALTGKRLASGWFGTGAPRVLALARWRRWGRWIVRRPWTALLVSLPALVALAAPLGGLDGGGAEGISAPPLVL